MVVTVGMRAPEPPTGSTAASTWQAISNYLWKRTALQNGQLGRAHPQRPRGVGAHPTWPLAGRVTLEKSFDF